MAQTSTQTLPLVMQVGITEQEQNDLLLILERLRAIRADSGWGKVEVVLKNGEIHEVAGTVTVKPKKIETGRD